MNEIAKLLVIILSAAVAALLVHDLLELGQAHARDMILPAVIEGVFYD